MRRLGALAYGGMRAHRSFVPAVVSILSRHRSRIAATVGLTLLALGFAYRYAPDRSQPFTAADDELSIEALDAASSTLAAAVDEAPVGVASPEPVVPIDDAPSAAELAATAALSPLVREQIADFKRRAAAAEAAGQLVLPLDDNAADWFAAASELDRGDRAARAGRARVIAAAIARVDDALDAGSAAEARARLDDLVAMGDLDKEVARLTQRLDALPDVEEKLREGARRMAQGQRFAPPGTSALDSYRGALAIDPRSRVAQQGIARVQEALAAAALEAAGNDDFDNADRFIASASELGADAPALAAAVRQLDAFRARRAATLIEAASAALDTRDIDSAADLADRARALAPTVAGLSELSTRIVDARTYGSFRPGEGFRDAFVSRAGSGPDLVVVPLGSFRMGAGARERDRRDHERPQREVVITRAFALARTETSVSAFREFVEASGYVTRAEALGSATIYDQRSGRMVERRGVTWRNSYDGGVAHGPDPVVHVAWADANAFAAWLTESTGKPYRLPSEAEFEYALRARTTTRYGWGDGDPPRVLGNFSGLNDRSPLGRTWTRGFANYGDGFWGPAPVASFPENAFGLRDLDGNVSEWVADCWHDSYLRAPEDQAAWVNPGCARRVLRAGSWASAPDQFRSAARASAAVDTRSGRSGFRVARDL